MRPNLLPAIAMAKRLDVDRLGEWLDAVLMRIEPEYGGLNGDLMWSLGSAMSFPSRLMPTNDDQPDPDGTSGDPRRDPG